MKMVSNYGKYNNWKHINVPLASFACGLALATVAFIGGGEILRDIGSTQSSASLTQTEARSIGVVMDEPDFGSVAVDYSALRQPRPIGVVMDEPDFGYLGIESAPAVVDPYFGMGAESVPAIEGDYLGLGQPSVSQSFTSVQSAGPRPLVYVVGSQELAQRLAAVSEADLLAIEGFDVPVRPTSFLVISTPEDENTLNETLMEQLLLTEPTLDIVDMRH